MRTIVSTRKTSSFNPNGVELLSLRAIDSIGNRTSGIIHSASEPALHIDMPRYIDLSSHPFQTNLVSPQCKEKVLYNEVVPIFCNGSIRFLF